jgi:hypothetical protein
LIEDRKIGEEQFFGTHGVMQEFVRGGAGGWNIMRGAAMPEFSLPSHPPLRCGAAAA